MLVLPSNNVWVHNMRFALCCYRAFIACMDTLALVSMTVDADICKAGVWLDGRHAQQKETQSIVKTFECVALKTSILLLMKV